MSESQVPRENGRRIAVLCGVDEVPKSTFPKLGRVSEEIDELKKLLTTELHPNLRFELHKGETYSGEELTRAGLIKLIRGLKDYDNTECIFFYLAGHGFPNQDVADTEFLTYDAWPLESNLGVHLRHLRGLLNQLPAKNNIAVLDFCYSGAISTENLDTLSIIASSQSDQVADAGGKSPSFTRCLINAIKEAQPNPKGFVTWNQIAHYARTAHKEKSNVAIAKYDPGTIGDYLFNYRPGTPESSIQESEIRIQEAKKNYKDKVRNCYSQIRLLGGGEISVERLYVPVRVINQLSRDNKDSSSMQRKFDFKNDRYGLGKRKNQYFKEGIDIAKIKPKLAVFGKPGSGKTTFLRNLAVDWCKDKFFPELVAVLIELRKIKVSDDNWNLIQEIDKELQLENWDEFDLLKKDIRNLKENIDHLEEQIRICNKDIKNNNKKLEELDLNKDEKRKIDKESQKINQAIQTKRKIKEASSEKMGALKIKLKAQPLEILLRGRLLLLIDGLDEVSTIELRRNVVNQLREFHNSNNRLIFTCRTQIEEVEAVLADFTLVEVVDFDYEQAQKFVINWLTAKDYSPEEAKKRWVRIDQAIQKNPDLKEMTVIPILLSLMCLYVDKFDNEEEDIEIFKNREILYEKGINLLLDDWNNEKKIHEWQIGSKTYHKLKLNEKRELLQELAAHKFENPNNFVLFEQPEITDQIVQCLNMKEAEGLQPTEQALQVLKAIEAHHGLLIERAEELWSFSHLTFQEHFTVQWLINLRPEKLAEKIADQNWRDTMKGLIKSQQPADRLVNLIRKSIDLIISRDSDLAQYLSWVSKKARAIEGTIQEKYKPAAIRAFYFSRDLHFADSLLEAIDSEFKRNFNRNYSNNFQFDIDAELYKALRWAKDICENSHLAPINTRHLIGALSLNNARTRAYDSNPKRDLSHSFDLGFDSRLENDLEQLRREIPDFTSDPQELQSWWLDQGNQWLEQLWNTMKTHRDIPYTQKPLNDQQKKTLEDYYNAHHFLFDLIKIDGSVSEKCLCEIEYALFLPCEEQKQQ